MKAFIFILLLSVPNFIHAQIQHISIRGNIVDETTLKPLNGASIQCYRLRDSIKLSITTSDRNGSYILDNLPNEKMFLTISFLGYENLVFEIQEVKSSQKDFLLKKQSVNLIEIKILGQRNLVTYKKDTISFDATFYKVNDDAMLTSLLKKFPGFSISTDAKIIYNGKPIERILIEGRIYFGEDIQTALKSLPADLISKIQVVNDYSNEARLLGDIKEDDKIINIQIKKEKKNVPTGQLEAGLGNNNRYNSKILFNKFQNKNNLTIYASGNNLNEYLDGNSTNDQLLRIWVAGSNYSASITKKLNIFTNYKFENRLSKSIRNINRQYFLDDTSYHYNQTINSSNTGTYNTISGKIQYNPDSSSQLSLNNTVNIGSERLKNNTNYNSLTEDLAIINNGVLFGNNFINKYAYSGSVQLDKKLPKEGTMSLITEFQTGNSNIDNENKTENIFNDSIGKPLTIQTNQKSTTKEKFYKTRLALFYKRPFGKATTVGLSTGILFEKRPTLKNTLNYDSISHSYNFIDDSLTISQKNSMQTTYSNVYITRNIKKWEYTVAMKYSIIKMYSQIGAETHSDNYFSIFYPSAFIKYEPRENTFISFTYDTKVTLPTFMQLTPIPDNSNPSIIRMSNPYLKKGLGHNFIISYSSFDYSNQKSISVVFDASIIDNQIIDGNRISSTGSQIILPVNVDGIQSYSLSIMNEIPLKKNFIQLSLMSRLDYGVNAFIPYETKQSLHNLSLEQNTRLKFMLDKFMDINCGNSIKYTQLNRMNTNEGPVSLLGYNLNIDNNFFLPFNFSINTSLVYSSIKQQESSSNSLIINFIISKEKIFHNKLIIKLLAYDLLNRNRGLQRSIGTNYIEEAKSLSFGRTILFDCILKL